MNEPLFSFDIAADGTTRRRFAEPFRLRPAAASPEHRQPPPVAADPLPAA